MTVFMLEMQSTTEIKMEYNINKYISESQRRVIKI
jgi:hypothetical protein